VQNIAFHKAAVLSVNTTNPLRPQISYFVSGPASERTPERFVLCLADLPKDGPHITGEEEQYQVGEEISLNCTSGKSYPASELQWYINDEQVTAISRHYHGRTVPFNVSLSMQNISHRHPASGGTSADSCLGQGHSKGDIRILKLTILV
jgi:hypothetical protein